MQTRVQKWGNSLAVRIPKSVAALSHIGQDSILEMSVEDGRIVLLPAVPATFSLEELLEGITPENLHQEADTGASVGQEAW